MKRFIAGIRHYLNAEQGSVIPLVALGIVVLVGAAGTAIDMGRVQIVQSRMQNSLDAAGLAVGSEASTVDVGAETTKYFFANFPNGYMGTVITSGPSATPNETNTLITLNVAGTVSTTFIRVFGINSLNVSATSQITRQSKGMELVLVIDNTGSMAQSAGGGVSKISAAKSAATSLLNILYGGNNTSRNLWVGLVPFSQAVNVGSVPNVSNWLDGAYDATLDWGPTSWYGCVEARTNGSSLPQYDISDDPPSVKLFRQYYSPCNTSGYGSNQWWYTTTAGGRHGRPTKLYCDASGGAVTYSSSLSPASEGPNLYCPQPVQPMVAEENTVVTAINNMQAVGNTHIDLGLAWGWRMLSPRWRGLWGGEMDTNSLPLDYNTPLMNKVIILMTDGDNTLSGTNSPGVAPSYPSLYSAYGFTGNNWLADNPSECTSGGNCTVGQNDINDRTLAVCNAMKAQGVIIYTIALGAQVSSTGQNMLRSCATSNSFYFLSPTTNELQGIFQQIGDSLANLYISQ